MENREEMQKHLTSYLNKDQFNFFSDNLKVVNNRMVEQSLLIDEIENKLIEINKNRKNRRKQNDDKMKNIFIQGITGDASNTRKVEDSSTNITNKL